MKNQLKEFLQGIKGSTIATILVETSPNMVKTGNPYWGRVKKRSRVNGIIGFSYESCVNNQRVREANPQTIEEVSNVEKFFAQLRSWGKRIQGTPLVEHKGKYYLEMKVERVLDSGYYIGDNLIDKALVEQYLVKKKESEIQKVVKPVILRDYSLESIKSIIVNGKFLETNDE